MLSQCWWWGTTQARATKSGGIPQSLISPVLLGQSTIQERFKEVRMVAEGWCRRSFTQWYQVLGCSKGTPLDRKSVV